MICKIPSTPLLQPIAFLGMVQLYTRCANRPSSSCCINKRAGYVVFRSLQLGSCFTWTHSNSNFCETVVSKIDVQVCTVCNMLCEPVQLLLFGYSVEWHKCLILVFHSDKRWDVSLTAQSELSIWRVVCTMPGSDLPLLVQFETVSDYRDEI